MVSLTDPLLLPPLTCTEGPWLLLHEGSVKGTGSQVLNKALEG